MKLAFVHPFFLRYARGIERYTANLASALAVAGAQVDILTWRWPNPLTWAELNPAVRVLTLPTARYYAARFVWPFLLAHLWRERYDHIFIHFADYGEAPALNLARRQPYTVVLHFPYHQVPQRYHSLVSSGLLQRATHRISVSEYVAREMREWAGYSSRVISHGVDLGRFRPQPESRASVRAQLGLDPTDLLILSVCALEMRKGVQRVLRALPIVLRQIPEVHYLVVGDGPDGLALRRLREELGLTRRVHFLPATPDVQRYYQAADVFAILAHGEASSLVGLEALACGLPVIAAQQPPFDELIQPAWGCQVAEGDPSAVAVALCNLLTDPAARAHLGLAGRAYIEANHTWQMIAARYLEFLV